MINIDFVVLLQDFWLSIRSIKESLTRTQMSESLWKKNNFTRAHTILQYHVKVNSSKHVTSCKQYTTYILHLNTLSGKTSGGGDELNGK